MDEELIKAFNEQLRHELENSYLYLAMAAYFEHKGLDGFAAFFKKQAREELGHAMRIYDFLVDRGVKPLFYELSRPKQEWDSVVEAARDFYEREVDTTKRIWRLVDLARSKNDKAAEVFLDWFVNEQVEEERSASDMLGKVEMVRDAAAGLLALDRYYAMIASKN